VVGEAWEDINSLRRSKVVDDKFVVQILVKIEGRTPSRTPKGGKRDVRPWFYDTGRGERFVFIGVTGGRRVHGEGNKREEQDEGAGKFTW